MISSVGQAFGILRGRRMGSPEEAAGLLNNQSPEMIAARARSESKTNSRPKSYAKKYKMGMKVY